eukprot:CAMPEP_0171367732 /NCGR_PEP_ID=MMETSP0879-20121228/6284_1 /TAXON_ID=67004 /ORGANISM="Thalassiosira weissflogii, Strain CCMP1336" /LENGTH=171 /DNA_ID=CAMNT_0011875825 /DNA_START=72 /DNA_END=587 /DNA_ORIENTATION=-
MNKSSAKLQIKREEDGNIKAEGEIEINSMTIRDGETGELFWRCLKWNEDENNVVEIPAKILESKVVSRETTFTSKRQINDFNIVQRVLLEHKIPNAAHLLNWICLEEWSFHFGFVIPGSTNTWQSVVVAADRSEAAGSEGFNPRDAVLVIETNFYDGKKFISKSIVNVRYA